MTAAGLEHGLATGGNVDRLGLPHRLHRLGPLHNQYDSTPCAICTAICAAICTGPCIDGQVARRHCCEGKLLDKISIHHKVGHLAAMDGESIHPAGHCLIPLNKLATDRVSPVGLCTSRPTS